MVRHAGLRGLQAQEESSAAKAAMAKAELEKNSAIQIKDSTEWKCKEVWFRVQGLGFRVEGIARRSGLGFRV